MPLKVEPTGKSKPSRTLEEQRRLDTESFDQPQQETGSVTLGLVPAPDLPEKIAYELIPELPGLLADQIDDKVSWKVPVVRNPLSGGEGEGSQILDEAQEVMERRGWDYAIVITDLPIVRGGRVVVAAVRMEPGVAVISVPALGATRLRRRVREATLQLASEMRWGTSKSDRDREERAKRLQEEQGSGEDTGTEAGESPLRGRGARELVGRRLPERLFPIRRVKPTDDSADIDVRYIAPRLSGRVRLLSGMVLANNPFALFATLKSSLVAAFATGTYALIFSSVRVLSDYFGPPRLIAFMLLSMAAIILWLVIAYGLWDRPTAYKSRRLSRLYNTVTALTLILAVLSLYAALLVMALLATMFLVPAELFESTIGRPPDFGDYLSLALVVASLSTIAGSLGLGAEDRETVLKATYGYRQRRRSEEGEKAERSRKEEASKRKEEDPPPVPEPWQIHRRDRG